MRKGNLLGALNGIVRVALASSAGAGAIGALAVIACGTNESAGGADGGVDGPVAVDGGTDTDARPDPFADEGTFSCNNPLPKLLENLTPAIPVDYLELRRRPWTELADGGVLDGGPPAATTVETWGTACAGATQVDACTAALASIGIENDEEGWFTDGDIIGGRLKQPFLKDVLVYTRGDEVRALRNPSEVDAFLGTIDSFEEARLLLQAANQPLKCTTSPYRSGWRENNDGSWELILVEPGCGGLIPFRARYRVAKDGVVSTLAIQKNTTDVCGRRPAGLVDPDVGDRSAVELGAHFACVAHLEAASVIAFRRLELELRRFGAPPDLVLRAIRSRADEIRHARETARLARRFGGNVPAVEVSPMVPRSLLSVALENAVEGCVRETYGALVAAFQAARCSQEMRSAIQGIARDEARHAELAHDVARWIERRLSPADRIVVSEAQSRALAELRAAVVAHEPALEVVRFVGMPTSAEARALLDGLDREILSAA